MNSAADRNNVDDLLTYFDEKQLTGLISSFLTSKGFQEFVGIRNQKKMLETCVAYNGSAQRKTVRNLPPPVTAKSTNALNQQLRRVPLDMLPTRFIAAALNQHFLSAHAELSRDCLSLLGLQGFEKGNVQQFITVDERFRTEEVLIAMARRLAAKYGVTLVKQYLAALSFQSEKLAFLKSAIVYVESTAVNDLTAQKPDLEPENRTHSIESAERPNPLDADRLESISNEKGVNADDPLMLSCFKLADQLSEKAAAVKSGIVVDPRPTINLWSELFAEVSSLRQAEGMSDSASVQEIRAAIVRRSHRADLLVLERMTQIRPLNQSSADAIRPISKKATELVQKFRGGHGGPNVTGELELFRLIDSFLQSRNDATQAPDLVQVSALQTAMVDAFGPMSALAIVAGHATLDEDRDQILEGESELVSDVGEEYAKDGLNRKVPEADPQSSTEAQSTAESLRNGERSNENNLHVAREAFPGGGERSSEGPTIYAPNGDAQSIDPHTDPEEEREQETIPEDLGRDNPTHGNATDNSDQQSTTDSETEDSTTTVCATYEEFRAQHWIDGDGEVKEAPWVNRDTFISALNVFTMESLTSDSIGSAYLAERAVEQIGGIPTIPADLLSDTADILNGEPTPERDKSRSHILLAKSAKPTIAALQLSLTVDAMFPAGDLWECRDELQTAIRSAGFSVPTIPRMISALINDAVENSGVRVYARRQIAAAMTANDGQASSIAEIASAVRKAFEALATVTKRLRTEHCRVAWRAFLHSDVESTLRSITKAKPSTLQLALVIEAEHQLRSEAIDRFDEVGAKFEDRTRMDRAVQALQQNLTMLRLALEDQQSKDGGHDQLARFDFPKKEDIKALKSMQIESRVEGICRDLLLSLARRQTSSDGMLLTESDLMKRPALALHLGFDGPVRIQEFAYDARRVTEPVEAAAVLLTKPFDIPEIADPVQTIKEHIFAIRRLDVMSMYLAEQSLNSAERSRLQRQLRAEGVDRADEMYRRLSEAWFECEAVGAPIANRMGAQLEEARTMLDQVEDSTFSETLTLTAWLDHLRDVCETQTRQSAESIRSKVAQRHPELINQIDEAISQKRFWELPLALDGVQRPAMPGRTMRWTPWRENADAGYSRTRDRLRDAVEEGGDELEAFVESWLGESHTEEARRHLRRMFFDFACGDMSTISKSSRRTKKDAPFVREIKQKRIVIDCRSVLLMLESMGTNPTFIPQLHAFTSMVILSAPKSAVSTSSNASVLARWIHSEIHDDAETHTNTIVVVLAPGVSGEMRGQIVEEFQRRQNAVVGVLIDDSDVLRMLGDRGAPPADIRPLLEVVIEQLPLNNAKTTPYSSQDGQHIRREMYVGRSGDAEALAISSRYSRVFSGRKLGKSAFLKSVADKYNNHVLSSGNRLSVLFVSIAGGDSESYICDRIARELSARFGPVTTEANGGNSGASDRLLRGMENILQHNPKDSILLLLDEADAFVEEQLRQYDREREKCLSFRLMKEVTQHMDSAGLPRIRVIFSGYRVTNTRDGAWANAGEVLILPPLSQDDANNLIVAPLARLGIDAHSQADFIARRCGNQPAIINKLGDTLLKHLKDTSPVARKEVLRLSNAHVVSAFNDPGIADEIRTVMFNNFQGNPVGQIVFAAMLLAFSRLAPGFELPDAESSVLTQIRSIDSNLDWLERRDPSLTGEIERQLSDFQDRRLVRRTEVQGSVFYRLQVSHSLPILLAGDLPGQIKRAIHTLRSAHGFEIQPVRGVLSEAQLSSMRAHQGGSNADALYVVSSHWPTALDDPRVGIADRLGIPPDSIADSKAFRQNDWRAVKNGSTADLESCVKERANVRLITGGIDLARRVMQRPESPTDKKVFEQSLSRVSAFGVRWWFERVRSYNFATSDAIERLMAVTGCIPLLLSITDDLIKSRFPEEADISISQFAAIEEDLVTSITKSASEMLRNGPDQVRLEGREIEVLKMLCIMVQGLGSISLKDDFNEEYWLLAAEDAYPDFATPTRDDAEIVELLVKMGLLKSEDGVMTYDHGAPDPIYAIAAVL